jgi:hypothetical protein
MSHKSGGCFSKESGRKHTYQLARPKMPKRSGTRYTLGFHRRLRVQYEGTAGGTHPTPPHPTPPLRPPPPICGVANPPPLVSRSSWQRSTKTWNSATSQDIPLAHRVQNELFPSSISSVSSLLSPVLSRLPGTRIESLRGHSNFQSSILRRLLNPALQIPPKPVLHIPHREPPWVSSHASRSQSLQRQKIPQPSKQQLISEPKSPTSRRWKPAMRVQMEGTHIT